MKYVTHFLKQMIFPLIYALIMMMINISISLIPDHLAWLRYMLYALSLSLYGFIIGAVAFKDGQEAVKIQHMNDTERLNIIRTGEDRPLNLVKEYKPWKGFVSGLSVCLPLIILMIIHGILLLVNPSAPKLWAGALSSYIYIIIFAFFRPDSATVFTGLAGGVQYFYCLLAIPAFMLMMGVPYYLGARKQKLLYKSVEDKHKAIYGDKA